MRKHKNRWTLAIALLLTLGLLVFAACEEVEEEEEEAWDPDVTVEAPRAPEPVTLSGDVEEWLAARAHDTAEAEGEDEDRELSATGLVMWDDDNLYIGVEVIDPEHSQPHADSDIDQGDSLQVGLYLEEAEGWEDFVEIWMALDDDGEIQEALLRGEDLFELGEIEKAVTRDDDAETTFYELVLPLETLEIQNPLGLTIEGDDVFEPPHIRFSWVINDADEDTRVDVAEWGKGLLVDKDVDQFGAIVFTDEEPDLDAVDEEDGDEENGENDDENDE